MSKKEEVDEGGGGGKTCRDNKANAHINLLNVGDGRGLRRIRALKVRGTDYFTGGALGGAAALLLSDFSFLGFAAGAS